LHLPLRSSLVENFGLFVGPFRLLCFPFPPLKGAKSEPNQLPTNFTQFWFIGVYFYLFLKHCKNEKQKRLKTYMSEAQKRLKMLGGALYD
jgi:hypothetical protein